MSALRIANQIFERNPGATKTGHSVHNILIYDNHKAGVVMHRDGSPKPSGMTIIHSPFRYSCSPAEAILFRPAGSVSTPHRVTNAACPTKESPLSISRRTSVATLSAVAGCTRIRATPPFLIRSRRWIAICQKSRSKVKRIRPSVSARSKTSLSPARGKSLPAHKTS